MVFATEMDFCAEAPLAIAQGFCLGLTTDGSSSMLMRSNHTAINKMKLSAKLTRRLGLLLQLLQNLLPKPPFSPGVKSPHTVSPYRSGKSRHGDPVRKTQRIPLIVMRWSFAGRPPLGLGFGINGCKRCH
jgi:hypothetical protein